jgi:hydroxymethylglutaryl-CoA reductase (NADPH)
MTVDHRSAVASLARLLGDRTGEELLARLSPSHHERPPRVPGGTGAEPADLERRWTVLAHAADARSHLLDDATLASAAAYAHNVENLVGTVKVPVGVAGPLRVNGTHARGDYYVPLATTEAALVASYHRGALLLSEAGGCAAALLHEGVARSPGFAFATLQEAGHFVAWVVGQVDELRRVAEATSRFAKLRDMRVNLEGNHVYLIFEYTTGDAAGQNMVTIATQAICELIAERSPVRPRHAFVEANHSGDKKASAQSFLTGRGKSVTCEAVIPAALVERRLGTTPEAMVQYWAMSAMGGVLSGTIGVQGHYANGLAAVYLACGQDVACVAESAVGVTRYELAADGALYAAVTLPNLIVGTVGGGTGLPSQRACLDVLGLAGAGHANAFAEVCAALALAGELSIVGALVAGDFTRAHQRLARA